MTRVSMGKFQGIFIQPIKLWNLISIHLKLCLATTSHKFKWVKITHILLILDQTFANLDVQTLT